MGFRLVTGFIEHLKILTTSNHSTIADSHSEIHYSTYLSLLSLAVFWQQLPTVDVPLLRGSLIIPLPQLPASKSNSSQGLNHSRSLTHSLTTQITALH
jgi:hypothetical protein